jgi:class III poly(R)-hydroxyalkanoic acid synthase PhaE subunit
MRTGEGKAGHSGGGGFDFGEMAQRYWQTLGETLRGAGGRGQAQDPWRAALDGWSRLAGSGSEGTAADAIERFSVQARQWLGTMQQVASQFAGRPAVAGDIAAAWKDALGGANPFADLMHGLGGRGQTGFDQWYAQVAPMLGAMSSGPMSGGALFAGMRDEGLGWLRLPTFGLAREHQERWQALAEAQLELQRCNDEYAGLMLEAGRDAFERFERKLAERSEPGRQLQSARALFDLWIDAAEEAYAEIALSKRFRRIYGDLVNAQMRVRAGIQGEIERIGGLLGLPGRTEVDAAHRRIAELERQVRRLSKAQSGAGVARAGSTATKTEPAAAKPEPKARPKTKPASARAATAAAPDAEKPSAKPAAGKTKASAAKASAARARKAAGASRAAAPAPSRRAPRQAIAAIPMPEPLKPMPAKTAAKRKR